VLGAVHSPGRPGGPGGSGRPGGPGRDLDAEQDFHAELLLRSLSVRERQVLDLLARGYSNRRIAEACYLSLNTVRTHVQNVLVKLGVHSKLEAAALAVRQGLVRIEDYPT
jgi:DNA-binding NarL/FixJ family response regulator